MSPSFVSSERQSTEPSTGPRPATLTASTSISSPGQLLLTTTSPPQRACLGVASPHVIITHYQSKRCYTSWAEETAPWFRALVALTEDLSSVPRLTCCLTFINYPRSKTSNASPEIHGHQACTRHTEAHAGKTHIKTLIDF